MIEKIPAKTIVTNNKKPGMWFGCEYNMNIYRGCSHLCIYCDSRSKCYRDDNFSKVKVKENALETIRNDLRRKVKKGVVATGAMSDPYNPLEKELLLTRHALELISAFHFGVAIDTKSDLLIRDIDILEEIKVNSPVIVKYTITTFDDELSKIIEPNVASSSERFKAIKTLSDNGIYTGILLMPILPFINDTKENIINIIEKAHEVGARFIYPSFGVTLRDRQREYYYNELDKNFPGLKEMYIKRYGNSYYCGSPNSKELRNIFTKKCDELGLLYNMRDIINNYKLGYEIEQLRLF